MNFKMSDKKDFVVVRKVLRGEKDAFEYIFNKYKKFIYKRHLCYLKSSMDAEDATMITFDKIYNNLDKFSIESTFNAWISKIANNTMYDFHERKNNKGKNKGTVSIDNNIGDYSDKSDRLPFYVKDNNKNAEEIIVEKETKRILIDAIKSLNPRERTIMISIFYRGKSYEEVAYQMTEKISSVKPWVNRAKKQMKEFIKNELSK